MGEFLKSIVVLTLAGILVLPGGWCCRPAEAGSRQGEDASPDARPCCRNKQATAVRGCCQRQQSNTPARAPAVPGQSCCCVKDLNLKVDRPALPRMELGLMPALIPATTATTGQLCSPATEADLGAGPPLNILHCVWRC